MSESPNAKKMDARVPAPQLVDEACQLAAELLSAPRTKVESREAAKMSRLLADPAGKELTFHLADEVFRPPGAAARAATFRRLIKSHEVPAYLRPHERLLMQLGAFASRFVPGLVMPAITAKIRQDSQRVILAREEKPLARYFQKRSKINLNLLGEAILGEDEAQRRLEQNLELLAKPECRYLSVKISAIFSQINLLDQEGTLAAIQKRLRPLYRTGKFINLDMEEHRDLDLTCEAFKRTLDEPEFADLEAGIVLQAYLPDSFPALQDLTTWAKKRNTPIKIRIVKGANLAMEKVEASQHHWPQAPYHDKTDVDANYKRLLHYAFLPENAKKVRIGVASHNLFDIAYALLLRKHYQVEEFVELEMLEGMANEHARALDAKGSPVLFYAPIVRKEYFHSAIAYLVRRLDENTSPENFLAHVFSMQPGDAAFKEQEARFRESFRRISNLKTGPNRKQDRNEISCFQTESFENSPETDWVLPANRQWLARAIENYQPNTPPKMATMEEVQTAIQTAAHCQWSQTAPEERAKLLHRAAAELENGRGRLIACMRLEACKRPFEADVEVSEAVDFSNYYAHRTLDHAFLDGTTPRPLGTIVVTPPWNFPCAIPCGGVLAALAAGNCVIIKPASEVIQTGWEMVRCLWQAGIPKEALQFLPCPDNEIGKSLVSSPEIDGIILTGSSETADLFHSWRPDLPLFAETSGKNALVITESADPDLAIKDLVKSAFGHAGQKCSAASLAFVEAGLYDNENFRQQLRDAAASLPVGEATDPAAIVTPLIQDPSPALLRGLTQIDEGESWLLEPKQHGPKLWSPGIRLDVKPNSWIHRTELFGPVLALIRVENLDEAISLQNSSDFGLTGGIHSLDPGEIARWRELVEVGNAYINRPITGAIVRRQPFGGWKRSSVGPGAKAGGPNYLTQFCHWEETGLPDLQAEPSPEVSRLLKEMGANDRLTAAARSYAYWWREEFSKEHDPSGLLGETNHFCYRVAPEVVVENPSELQILAAATVGTRVVSRSEDPLAKKLPEKALVNGRLELLHYLHEQSISETTHRHGRVSPPLPHGTGLQ
jgi:RHH-type proline utilization regulon transcriptional repressor/proline dehydrogenase/delta 1-pyrroline-5-carboxylate dehydrogenase